MVDQMTRLQHEAEERAVSRSPLASGYMSGYEHGFIDGRTISREQFNRASWAVREASGSILEQIQADLRIALEAAGMVIED